jgi:hypothetical protein
MAGGFDAGQALRGGVGDRRQAWEFIRRFAAEWTTPLVPGDGVSRDAWRAAEDRIGAELPAALREAYLLFGRRPDLTARQDRLVPAHQLSLDESGTTTTAPSSPTDVCIARPPLARCWNSHPWPATPPRNKPMHTTSRPPRPPATSSAGSPATTPTATTASPAPRPWARSAARCGPPP